VRETQNQLPELPQKLQKRQSAILVDVDVDVEMALRGRITYAKHVYVMWAMSQAITGAFVCLAVWQEGLEKFRMQAGCSRLLVLYKR